MKIRAVIPHYLSREAQTQSDLGGNYVPGSARGGSGQNQARRNAVRTTVLSLLRHHDTDVVCDHRYIYRPGRMQPLEPQNPHQIDITVLHDGVNHALEQLEPLSGHIEIKAVELQRSRDLVWHARDLLLDGARDWDLYLYLEDDIGITDPEFFDKIHWFAETMQHRAVLMPHRWEQMNTRWDINRVYIDGPLDLENLSRYYRPRRHAQQHQYRQRDISFNLPANPHSAVFCVTEQQLDRIAAGPRNRDSEHISEFESCATLTVLRHFPIYKPSWQDRRFLEVQHLSGNYTEPETQA